jgi:hypothetical protein
MSETTLFDWAAEALQRASSLSRLEARGALRLALKRVGLDPGNLTRQELTGLLRGPLVKDLEERHLPDADGICKSILGELSSARLVGVLPGPVAGKVEAPSVFDWVADAVQRQTGLGRLEARGTVRVALKEGGLTAEELTKRQAAVVLAQLLPAHLRARVSVDADGVCAAIAAELLGAEVRGETAGGETPAEVFDRLGSRAPA